MDSKRSAVAAGFIIFCYWLVVLRFRSDTPNQAYSTSFEISSAQFEYTNLENSHGKVGQKLWKSIIPSFKCPDAQLARIGKSGDGGKWTCGLYHLGSYYEENPSSSCVVYSFGVNKDSSFEAEVLANTRCVVYAYDPTVKSIAKPISPSNPRLHFFKMGVGGNNTKNLTTLKTMMEENGGHEWIDIIKMDIEGSEYKTFEQIFLDFPELPFGQLLVELHFRRGNKTTPFSEVILQLISKLESKGFRMFYTEINEKAKNCCSEFSFLNIKTLNRFMDL